MRTYLLALCLAVCARALPQQTQAQQPIRLGELVDQSQPKRPLNVHGLGELVSQIASDDLLNFAQQASVTAKQEEDRGRVLDAALQYERLLQHIEQDPGNRDTTAIHLMRAAAYIDAARTRFQYATRTKDSDSTEKASQYLGAAQNEITASVSKRLMATVPLLEWSCSVARLSGQSYYMEALINRNPPDLDSAAKAYQKVVRCEPSAKPQVDKLLSHINSVRRTMTNSPISGDAVVQDIQEVVKLTVRGGDFVSWFVGKVWEIKKTHEKAPDIRVQ